MSRLSVLLLLVGCADLEDPCLGRRDLAQSNAGLTLTQEEHTLGWGKTQCMQCHQAWTIHQEDCIDGIAVDVTLIDPKKPEDCVECHGANGVAAWAEEAE